MKRFRDAITGLFIRPADAAARPDTTVAESSDLATEAANLRWANDSLVTALTQAGGHMTSAASDLRDPALDDNTANTIANALSKAAAEAEDAAKLYRRAA